MSIIERTGYGRWPKVPPTNEQRRKAWEDKYRHVPPERQIGDVLQREIDPQWLPTRTRRRSS